MTPPDLQLPDDIETLKAMVLAMAEKAARTDALESEVADLKARNADADERIERLTQILKAFDRARFGRRSEKLGSPGIDDEQQAFVFEEIETGKGADALETRRPSAKRRHMFLLRSIDDGPALLDEIRGYGQLSVPLAMNLVCLEHYHAKQPEQLADFLFGGPAASTPRE